MRASVTGCKSQKASSRCTLDFHFCGIGGIGEGYTPSTPLRVLCVVFTHLVSRLRTPERDTGVDVGRCISNTEVSRIRRNSSVEETPSSHRRGFVGKICNLI